MLFLTQTKGKHRHNLSAGPWETNQVRNGSHSYTSTTIRTTLESEREPPTTTKSVEVPTRTKHSQSAKHLVHAKSDNIGLLFSTIPNLRIFFSQAASASHPSYVNSTVSYAPLCQGEAKILACTATLASKILRWSVECDNIYRKET